MDSDQWVYQWRNYTVATTWREREVRTTVQKLVFGIDEKNVSYYVVVRYAPKAIFSAFAPNADGITRMQLFLVWCY